MKLTSLLKNTAMENSITPWRERMKHYHWHELVVLNGAGVMFRFALTIHIQYSGLPHIPKTLGTDIVALTGIRRALKNPIAFLFGWRWHKSVILQLSLFLRPGNKANCNYVYKIDPTSKCRQVVLGDDNHTGVFMDQVSSMNWRSQDLPYSCGYYYTIRKVSG